jgi:hypothetical protein
MPKPTVKARVKALPSQRGGNFGVHGEIKSVYF